MAASESPGVSAPCGSVRNSVRPASSGASSRRRFGRRGASKASPAVGQGTAWLIFDAGGDLFRYHCYWFGGRGGDHLIEHARLVTASDAVGWAAARTPRARIRLPDHRSYWAGSGPSPGGFAGVWQAARPERDPGVDLSQIEEPASELSDVRTHLFVLPALAGAAS